VLVGMMNNPSARLEDELRFAAEAGFDIVDLTLEPPGTWPPDLPRLRRALAASGLRAVGHTAWFVPIASPFDGVRQAAQAALREAIDAFAELGVAVVNIHPDHRSDPSATRAQLRERNGRAVASLSRHAENRGVVLAVEGTGFGSVADIGAVLDAAPAARFHLDIGHANLGPQPDGGTLAALLDAFGDRLVHVHASDNLGDADRHLPLGAGTIDWTDAAARLAATGYDGTVTLEVFSRERRHLRTSLELWRGWWRAATARG
jgi:sugar phosphate isomerase/epimerase